MRCKNCSSDGGKKGNKHVRGRSFTCTRRGPGGEALPDVSSAGLSDWSYSDESSGGSSYGYDSGSTSDPGGSSE